jgi:hypothetical protein
MPSFMMNARPSRSSDLTLKDGCLAPKAVIDDVLCWYILQAVDASSNEYPLNLIESDFLGSATVGCVARAGIVRPLRGALKRAAVLQVHTSTISSANPLGLQQIAKIKQKLLTRVRRMRVIRSIDVLDAFAPMR